MPPIAYCKLFGLEVSLTHLRHNGSAITQEDAPTKISVWQMNPLSQVPDIAKWNPLKKIIIDRKKQGNLDQRVDYLKGQIH